MAVTVSLHGPGSPVAETQRTKYAALWPMCSRRFADHLAAALFNFSAIWAMSGTPPGYIRQPMFGAAGTGKP